MNLTETAKIVGGSTLSPILEMSYADTVLENLSSVTEGDITDRNIEEILHEAEELMKQSYSNSSQLSSDSSKDNDQGAGGSNSKEIDPLPSHRSVSSTSSLSDKIYSSANPFKTACDLLSSFTLKDFSDSEDVGKINEKGDGSHVKNESKKKISRRIGLTSEITHDNRKKKNSQKENRCSKQSDQNIGVIQLDELLLLEKEINSFSPKSTRNSEDKIETRIVQMPTNDEEPQSKLEHFKPDDIHNYLDFLEIELKKSEKPITSALESELLMMKRTNKKLTIEMEKQAKQYQDTTFSLQREIAMLKAQIPGPVVPCSKSDRVVELLQQERQTLEALVQASQKENAKLCLQLKELSEKLKKTEEKCVSKPKADPATDQLKDKEELIIKLQMDIEDLKSALTARSTGSDRLQTLEQQYQLLKSKYEDKINKLEIQNKQLQQRNWTGIHQKENVMSVNVPSRSNLTDIERRIMDEIPLLPLSPRKLNYSPLKALSSSDMSLNKSSQSVQLSPEFLPKKTSKIPTSPYTLKKKPVRSKSSLTISKTSPTNQTQITSSLVQTDSPIETRHGSSQTEQSRSSSCSDISVQCNLVKEDIPQFKEVSCQTTEEQVAPELEIPHEKDTNSEISTKEKKKKKTEKYSDHESHLMATLRGVQSELSMKEKENKRLKLELESAKVQIKKMQNINKFVPGKPVKKCNTGSQTIGLELPRPYDPALFECK